MMGLLKDNGLKKGVAALTVLLAVFFACAALAERTIVTSFFPVYVLTQAVIEGAEGVRVANMAEQAVGCLHDYQLTPRDVAALEEADAFVVCGGGMEQFMDRVQAMRPEMPVIETTEGIALEPSWEEGLMNAHVWLSPLLAARQTANIAEGLAAVDEKNAAIYRANAAALAERLAVLDANLKEMLTPCRGEKIVTFHEAFTYFAEAYGIEIAGVVAHEPGENPSTREIAETCDLVQALGVRALFAEPQYPALAAEIIARETGAALYTLDPFVSGEGTMEGYEAVLRENARILLEALTR